MSLQNTARLVGALYDQAAEGYFAAVARTRYVGPEWLLANLQPGVETQGLKVLDLGCANGINMVNLKEINRSLVATGVDISTKMIAEAEKSGLYEQLYHQSMDDGLAFSENDQFGMVLALGCLEFVNDIDFCLSEVARVCVEGGFFYASFQRFEQDNPAAPRRMRSGDVHHFAYSPDEIRSKLNLSGFEIVMTEDRIGYTGGAPCPYTFVVARKN